MLFIISRASINRKLTGFSKLCAALRRSPFIFFNQTEQLHSRLRIFENANILEIRE